MHHDLHKFRHSDQDTTLTQALKLDLTVLCPSLHLLYPELDEWLVKGELSRLISITDLCAALGQCCALCGRSVGAHDMYLHLRHQHPKDCARGALYYRYLVDVTPNLHRRSVCNLHLTAAHECPILLQLAGLLCRLHHGHRGPGSQSVPTDVGGAQDPGVHHGRARRLPAPIQTTEGRPSGSQRKGKRQSSPIHSADQSTGRLEADRPNPGSTITPTRRCFERPGHGAGLHAFFEPRSREHQLLTRVRKLQNARPEDDLVQTLIKFNYLTQGENSNDLRFSYLQWNPTQKAMEKDPDRAALTMQHVATQITKILTLLQQQSLIIRFGALRPNAQIKQNVRKEPTSTPQVVPWRLSLALTHRHSAETRSTWQELTHSGVWQRDRPHYRGLHWPCDH